MNRNRLWVIGSVTVMAVLVLAGWFLGAQPLLASAATADLERSGIDSQNAAQQAALTQLAADNDKLPELEKTYKALLQSIPSTSSTSGFIKGLDGLAAASGVTLDGFTIGSTQAYTVPASGAVVVPDPSATPDPNAPVADPVPVGAVAVTNSLITPANFVGITVGIDVTGQYEAALSFIKGLQSGERLFLVTAITTTTLADAGDNAVSAHIDGMIYVLKQPAN